MKQIISIIFAIACGNFIFAQQNCKFRISGIILSGNELRPVAGVEVFIEKGHYKTITDDKGHFDLFNLCPGTQMLELNAQGFEHGYFTIFLNIDSSLYLHIRRKSQALDSLQITAVSDKNKWLSGADMVRNLGKDLARNLAEIPGMAVLQTGNNVAKPVFQGFTGLRLPIFINGIRQEGQQWGNEHAPEISASGYESVSILRGAATLEKTHDAIAGLISIENNSYLHPGEVDVETGIGFNSNGRQFSAFSKIYSKPFTKKISWFVGASARKAGNYMAPAYTLGNTGLFEFTANAGLIWDKTPRWNKKTLTASYYLIKSGIFIGSKIGNVADLQAAILREEPMLLSRFSYKVSTPLQYVTHSAIAYVLESSKRPGHKLNFGLQYDNRREFDFHRSSKVNFPQLDLYLLTLYGEYSQKLRSISPTNYTKIGSNFQAYFNRYGGYFFIPNYKAWTQGIFISHHLQRGFWKYDMTLRFDAKYLESDWISKGVNHRQIRNFINYSTAFSAIYKNSLSFHFMRLWRAPWVNELYSYGVHHGSASFERGDAQLTMERDYKAEVVWGKKYRITSVYLSVFSNYMPGFINLSPDSQVVLTVRGAFPSYSYKQFTAWYSGCDARVELQISPVWRSLSQVSFVYARDLSHNTYPAYIPPLIFGQNLGYHRKKLSITLSYAYCIRQFLYTPGTDYLAPPASYSLWNFSIEFKRLFKKQNYHLFFNVDNILNLSYRNYLDRFRYFTDMPGRNISIKLVQNLHHHEN